MQSIAEMIDERLRELALPGRAEQEKAYLKSDLDHYGTPVPQIRATVKLLAGPRARLTRVEVLQLADHLWSTTVHERRTAAIEVLDLNRGKLGAEDLAAIEKMLRSARTWAHVDPLATNVAGRLVERFPELTNALDRWAGDQSFWLRRAAMLALLVPLRSGDGDFDRFSRYADAMLDEKEFFIRKAIGWVLRDTGKKRPDLVYEWILPRASRASGVTLREAVKPLSPEQRLAVQAAVKAT